MSVKENDVKSIFQSSSLLVLPDVPIGNIKTLIRDVLHEIPHYFCLYGSASSLDFDLEDSISDYDIFVARPASVFNYVEERIRESFPSTIVRGIEAMHNGTYRLRVADMTLLDISIVSDEIMNLFIQYGTKLPKTYAGYVIPELFSLGESCKMLLRPGRSFAPLPYYTDADRRKWPGKLEDLRDILKRKEPIPLHTTKTKCSDDTAIAIPSNVVHCGTIARLLYAHILGLETIGHISKVSNGIVVSGSVVHGSSMISYFNNTEIANTDISYKRMFNGVLPEYHYLHKDNMVIYNVKKLPPDYTYCTVNIAGVDFTLPSPLFLLFELISWQYMHIDHEHFQNDCSYAHHYDILLRIMRFENFKDFVRLILPGRLGSKCEMKSLNSVYRFNPEQVKQTMVEYNITMSMAINGNRSSKIGTYKEYPIALWGFGATGAQEFRPQGQAARAQATGPR